MNQRSLRAAAAGLAFALPSPAQGAIAPAPSGSAEPESVPPTCAETFAAGSEKPNVAESFPDKGKSGHALYLEVTLEHRKGEQVLPSGTTGRSEGDALRALEAAGFFLPDPKGGVVPTVSTEAKGDRARTVLKIPVLALPKKPGRQELTLPPLPVAIARASGEVRTLCTKAHLVTIEDPTANSPDAKPKGNPKPLRQIEEWTAAKHATIGALIALLVGVLVALLVRAWRRRPKPVPPPPPPRPPWEVALEELFDVKLAKLVDQGRFAEHFDRVSDAVRRYLGARYGFDGLETTTREALVALRKVSPRIVLLTDIDDFLHEADLVKFAKVSPEETACHAALARAEEIVRRTMPQIEPRPVTSQPGAAAAGASSPDAARGDSPEGGPR